ncbi:MAG: enoyl-CoA hydratase/isomerase family protein [Thermoproteota archaeon]|nr:enoyl-CoA hydratase/isomerase family protein [Thermoproteota archaeon]
MKNVITERKNNTLLIKINRPQVLNAINYDLVTELKDVIDLAGADEETSSIIITGEGEKSFSAGGDLKYVITITPTEAIQYAGHVHELLNKIEEIPKPVIAAINGYALGGGCQIALACDLRIASSNAKIGQPEVTIGISPGWGGTQRLSRIVGISKAKEMIFTGKTITAGEALKIKLVNQVIYPDNRTYSEKINGNIKIMDNDKNLKEKLIDQCFLLAKSINSNKKNSKTMKIYKTIINKGNDVSSDIIQEFGQLSYREKQK